MRLARLLAVGVIFTLGCLATSVGQQPSGSSLGDAIIERYLLLETAKLQDRFLDGARTKDEWENRRGRMREEYLEMLGLWPLPERTPLRATVTGVFERDDFKVEKL